MFNISACFDKESSVILDMMLYSMAKVDSSFRGTYQQARKQHKAGSSHTDFYLSLLYISLLSPNYTAL
jgi:hypothetical protein